VAIRITWTALPITSAGRRSPLDPIVKRHNDNCRLLINMHLMILVEVNYCDGMGIIAIDVAHLLGVYWCCSSLLAQRMEVYFYQFFLV